MERFVDLYTCAFRSNFFLQAEYIAQLLGMPGNIRALGVCINTAQQNHLCCCNEAKIPLSHWLIILVTPTSGVTCLLFL